MPVVSVNFSVSQAVTWLPWSVCSYTDALAVFQFQLTDEVTAAVQPTYLQPDELDRVHRYRQLADRHRFMYARYIVRLLLSQYCQQAPNTIRITTGLNGKPQLANTKGWQMNISHAGNWILIIIGRSSVGVDIELVNPWFVFQDLIPNSFSALEQQHIQTDAHPHLAFYRLWTRKEALVKATAKGIDDNFSQIPSLTGTHTLTGQLLGATGDWTVQSVPVEDDYIAAVAYPNTSATLKFYTIDGGFFTDFTS